MALTLQLTLIAFVEFLNVKTEGECSSLFDMVGEISLLSYTHVHLLYVPVIRNAKNHQRLPSILWQLTTGWAHSSLDRQSFCACKRFPL